MEVLTNNFVAKSFLWNSGLSRNKSLRTLEVTAVSIDYASDPVSSLKRMLSTTGSSAFLEVIVLYMDYDFSGVQPQPGIGTGVLFYRISKREREAEAFLKCRVFKVFHEVQKVRDFRLVLCADVHDSMVEYCVRVLKEDVAAEKAKGMFDGFSSEPAVIYRPRAIPTRFSYLHSPSVYIPRTPR